MTSLNNIMLTTLFYYILQEILADEHLDDESDHRFINTPYYHPQNYTNTIKAPFDEEEYKFSSGTFSLSDGTNRGYNYITSEILTNMKIKSSDYVIYDHKIFFKNLDDKIQFEKMGYDIHSEATAAINFNNLKKSEMGKISFTKDNIYYITIRPKRNKETELLSELTSFYKSHGYPVEMEQFQNNFYIYEDFALKVFVKDDAMAAELSCILLNKDLGVLL